MLHEALNLDIHLKIDATVLVLKINPECKYDSLHNIIKFVLYNVCELKKALKRDLVLSLAIFQLIRQFEHLLFGKFNLAFRCMHRILQLSYLSLQLLHLYLHQRSEFSIKLVDILATELKTIVPLLDCFIIQDFRYGDCFASLAAFLGILVAVGGNGTRPVHINAIGDCRSKVFRSLLFNFDPLCNSGHDVTTCSIFKILDSLSGHFVDVSIVHQNCRFIE